ncbi:ETC complex I subunit [Sphingomonas montana]|uniref:ETC complex I subunit n=1 Tax=Sphingomonas montana TaxID=1843236 RepID=UPI00096D6CC6|nr:ETC complex I subunit [Sphingomonas montana]
MGKARIYQRAKSSMSSGRARTGQWVLEHEPAERKVPDPLTGWAGSGDTNGQISLTFPTLEAAQAYAARNGLETTIIPLQPRKLKLQAYSDNFQ